MRERQPSNTNGILQKGILYAIAFVALTILGCWSGAEAQERSNAPGAYPYSSRPKAKYYRKRPLQVEIRARRRVGAYSYGYADVISTYGKSPPPWADIKQSPGGPFDSGFFFDSGIGPHGGNAPYLH